MAVHGTGALLGYPIGYFFGRKRGLLAASLIFLIGAGMMCGANTARGLGLIYGGRILAGIAIGSASVRVLRRDAGWEHY